MKKASNFTRTFALCVNDRPILAFAATGWREARELCKEPWLKEDLQALRSEGVPLCDAESVLSIRQATVEEDAAYKEGSSAAEADELPLAYLVALED